MYAQGLRYRTHKQSQATASTTSLNTVQYTLPALLTVDVSLSRYRYVSGSTRRGGSPCSRTEEADPTWTILYKQERPLQEVDMTIEEWLMFFVGSLWIESIACKSCLRKASSMVDEVRYRRKHWTTRIAPWRCVCAALYLY